MTGIKQVSLVEAPDAERAALAPSVVSTFERLASDPNMDVEKLERLMQMYERAKAQTAKEAFNAAMSAAQQEMRPIAADASNPQTRSKYASYAALDNALRPIYTKQGFGLSFDTGECPTAQWMRLVCYVSHSSGHEKTYHIDMPADGKGAKGGDVMTLTHATGAAASYGMRYLLKMIFNVAVGEADNDGNSNGGRGQAALRPAGFDAWWLDMVSVTEEGYPALEAAFKASKKEFREYALANGKSEVDALKVKAKAVVR